MPFNPKPAKLPLGRDAGAIERHRESLVVVEDPQISKLVQAVLRKRGYSVILSDPLQVMKLLRGPERFKGILVTNSPAAFLEFAEWICLLYLSGLPDPRLEALFGSCRVVRKPFAPEDLLRAVEELEAL